MFKKEHLHDYDKWLEDNDDELWISWHESGSCYDEDMEDYCMRVYDWQRHKFMPCPCGGYMNDWNSHASDCKEINSKGGKDYGG